MILSHCDQVLPWGGGGGASVFQPVQAAWTVVSFSETSTQFKALWSPSA